MKFIDLLEAQMSISDAVSALGLENSYSPEEVKSAYKKKAKENHPDVGGSVEMMKKINNAYELLKGKKSNSLKKSFDWEKMHKDYVNLCKNINGIVADSFEKKAYTEYFKNFFGQTFKFTKFKFSGEDYYKGKYKDQYGSPSFAGVSATIESKDGNIVINFSATVYLPDIKGSKGLADTSGVPSVPLKINAVGFFGGRQFKLYNKLWDRENVSTFDFNDVSIFFPESKLKKHLEKKKTSKATKKDFVSAIVNILKGKDLTGENTWACPIKGEEDLFLIINRGTMMRKGYYTFDITKKDGYRYIPTNSKLNSFFSLTEEPDVLDMLLSLKGKTLKGVESTLLKFKKEKLG